MNLIYFEDIEVGATRVKSIVYRVTREEIIEFAGRWDPRPFHLSDSAASASVFGELVACTAHIFSILSWFGTHGSNRVASLAALGFDELRIHSPVRPGDTLSCISKWLDKRESKSKSDRGISRTQLMLSNQDGKTVFSIVSTILVAKRSCELQIDITPDAS